MCIGSTPKAPAAQAPTPTPAPAAPPPILQTSVNEANKNGGLSESGKLGTKGLRIDRTQVAMGGLGGATGLNIPRG
jgi:hypothetical protein